MNRILLKAFPLFFLTSFNLYANSINVSLMNGISWASLHENDHLYLNSSVENSYKTKHANSPLLGIGGSYQFDHLFQNHPKWKIDIGASAYYARFKFSGINTPFINGGEFDTLTYHVHDKSFSLLFETKLLYQYYRLQPYVLAGLGVAWNDVYDYSEVPSNSNSSAVPLSEFFGNRTTSQFAYELGIGVQTLLYQFKTHHNLNLFVDYRYMNWGKLQLDASPLQTTSQGPDLGSLNNQVLSIGLQYQFC